MKPKYEIKFSKVRQKKGLQPWAVFEIVDEGFFKGISAHQTEAEAIAALAKLEGR